jgi:TolB-like protein/DNA-binding SARP family transcriptional activator
VNGGRSRAVVSLRLFAGASLEIDDRPLTGPTVQRHRLALLAVLAASHPAALPRDKLAAYLWPERDTEHARNLLSQAVYVLRKALGEEAILSAGDELRFNPTVVACDVMGFERALEADEMARAVALYSGPFLDGFFLAGAPELERWVERERERLAAAYGRALEALAEVAEGKRDYGLAVQWWKARAAHDPYDSRVALRLMHALEASGNPAGALRHAATHDRLLRHELGVEPSPEVRVAVAALRSCCEARTATIEAIFVPAGEDQPRADRPDAAAAKPELGAALPEVVHGEPSPWPRVGGDRRRASSVALAVTVILVVATSMSPGSARLTSRPDIDRAPTAAGRTASLAAVARSEAVTASRSLAVLPFANLSSDPEDAYFSDGLTEELTSALSRVRALRVVARTSAFAFKGESRDIRAIGRELDVGTLLEGSVRRDGDRVRVTAQLINAADGFHLWAETYERQGTDLLAIQSDLALRIASALALELTPAEHVELARRPTASPEAHALYLKGRYFWNQRTRAAFARAKEYFERATVADPRYARAHAGLASVYAMQGWQGYLMPRDAGERARAAALKALEIDGGLAEAHTVMGAYYDGYAWDSDAAEREHRRAIQLDPNYATAHHWYGNFLTAMGRFDEAIAHKRTALELDPLTPVSSETLGNSLARAGRFAEAIEAYRSAAELDSTYWRAHAGVGAVYETLGMLHEAEQAYRRAVALASRNEIARTGLVRTLARTGRHDEAQAMLDELREDARRDGIHQPTVATAFLAMDDVDGALTWLEQSYRERAPQLRHIGGPAFGRLEGDPRYVGLLRRAGLRRE